MASSLLTNDFKVEQAILFANSITSNPHNFYMFLGHPTPTQTNAIPDVFDDTLDTNIGVYRNLIIGKAVEANGVSQMIRNIPYIVGTAYNMYDDGNPFIFSDPFYAIVNAGAFSHVWKVLDNNWGSNSTIAPNVGDIDPTDQVYETSDGYRWKYMYSIDTYHVARFADQNWFPLATNTAVEASAVDGAIDVIQVVASGQGYNNWLTGTFAAGDIKVTGNAVLYSVTGNTQANQIPNFYAGSIMYIASGTGFGSYSTITQSFSNPSGTFVVLQQSLPIAPQNGSQYEIYPEVVIHSDGTQTSNARARALVNTAGNTVYRVEMLSRGAGYRYLFANVIAANVVGVLSPASVRPIYGPFGGHGSNVASELGATAVALAVTFANTESNTIPATNQYQQLGLMTTPMFANVQLGLSWANGIPLTFETGYVVTSRLLTNTSVTVTQGSTSVTSNNGAADLFNLRIDTGDVLLLQSGDNTVHQIVNVVTVTNSSVLSVSQNCLWSDSSAQIYLANLQTSFVVSGTGTGIWFVSNVVGEINAGDLIIGANSGAYAQVSQVKRSGVVKTFDTFIGMYSYNSTLVSGVFQQNEQVYQGITYPQSLANAALFAAISNGGTLQIYTSNQVGQFSNGGLFSTINGTNSGAITTLHQEWSPEIAFGSGRVLYVENVDAIARSGNTSDYIVVTIKL